MRDRLLVIVRRAREPSTAAGVGVLVAIFGGSAGLGELVVQIVAGAAALAAILLPEARQAQPAQPDDAKQP